MQLYYAPNTVALASLIVLEEVGAPYTPVRLDFSRNAQRAQPYLALNPKGRVPALVTPKGTLTETPAILTWLGQAFPSANLLPADPFGFARVQELLAYLCSTVHVSHAHKRRGARWSDDPAVVAALPLKVAQNMGDHFAYLEQRFTGPFAMGDHFTVADPYLFILASWLEGDGVDIARFPRIAAHFAALSARPAVQRALAIQS